MKTRIVVLGAGFGGLELSTLLSESLGDSIEVTLIDKSDSFVFGYSKLDVIFGCATLDAVRLPYRNFVKPGVRFLRQTITAIDPDKRRVTTDGGTYDADFLIVALGADYDMAATPGLAEVNEFCSLAGAARLRDALPGFKKGKALISVCGAPFKCPPAPSECALLLHDYLATRGVRDACEISFVLPLGSPVPPSPEMSRALVASFAERDITFIPGRRVASLDVARKVAILDDGAEMPYDLFIGVPKHRVPSVVLNSGMAEDGWIPVTPRTLETKYHAVYALGDGANTGTPKAASSPRARRAPWRATSSPSCATAAGQSNTMVSAPAISKSAAGSLARSRWISSPVRSRLEPITSRQSPCVRTRSISAPAVAPAGLAYDASKSRAVLCWGA